MTESSQGNPIASHENSVEPGPPSESTQEQPGISADSKAILDYQPGEAPAGLIVQELEPGTWRISEKRSPFFSRSGPIVLPLTFVGSALVCLYLVASDHGIRFLLPAIILGICFLRYLFGVIRCMVPQAILVDRRGISFQGVGFRHAGNRSDYFAEAIQQLRTKPLAGSRRGMIVFKYAKWPVFFFNGRSMEEVTFTVHFITRILQSSEGVKLPPSKND